MSPRSVRHSDTMVAGAPSSAPVRRRSGGLVVLAALQLAAVLLGCDAGKKPYEQAAALESQGNLKDAAQAYSAVCEKAKDSKYCAAATRRASQVRWVRAVQALGRDNPEELRAALEAVSKDSALSVQAPRLVDHPEARAAQSFADATQEKDPAAKNKKLLALSKEPVSFSAKARELTKLKPDVLLQAVKDACKTGGVGSCSATAQQLTETFPESPEAKEASELAKADLERMYSTLDKLEKFLIQRLETYNNKTTIDQCTADLGEMTCSDLPPGVNEKVIQAAFTKQLQEVTDPELKKAFEARWDRVSASGELDTESWPKPKK